MRTILGILLSFQMFLFSAEWKTDFEAASREAKANNKSLVLVFLGSEWCPWSQKLSNEVFSKAEFLDNVEELILVKIELSQHYQPDDKATLLKEKYHVEEIPSLLILNSEGKEIARIGYTPLLPKEFAGLFKEIQKSYEEISQTDFSLQTGDRLQELYFSALKYGFNEFRYQILGAGLQIDKTPFFLLEKYKLLVEGGKIHKKDALDVRKELIKRDPKNIFGVHRTLAIVDFHQLSSRYRLRKKPNEVVKPLVNYIKEFGSGDKEHRWKIEMMIAQFYFSHDQIQQSIKYAQDALKMAPEEAKEEIRQSIDFLRTYPQNIN